MAHQDVEVVARWIMQLVPQSIWTARLFRKDARWTSQQFLTTALLWSLGQQSTLTDRFEWARRQAMRLFPDAAKSGASYQAFMKIMVRWSDVYLVVFLQSMQRTICKQVQRFRGVHGFAVFGIDGSRVAVPRTTANQQRLTKGLNPNCRLRGRRRRRAQKQSEIPSIWVTMVWHLGAELPWQWKLGTANASERAHLLSLQDSLPEDSLLTADAGFAGYEYWASLIESRIHFIIRVGSGVHLLKELGEWQQNDDRIWLWPAHVARNSLPPLKLRLVKVQGKQGSVWLVTSVLSHQRLSDAAIGEIYRQRWKLEVFFRDFKRTFGKHKQLSRTPEHARVELHWSLMSLSVVLLDARLKRQQLKQQQRDQQHRTSVSGLLRVIRRAFDDGFRTSVDFFQAIQQAVIDRYHRVSKSRRACPQRRTRKPPGQPNIQKPPPNLNTLAQSIKPLTLTSYG